MKIIRPISPLRRRMLEDMQIRNYLSPHHRRVSALCRPICPTFPHLARSSRRRAYPHLSTPSPPAAGLRERLHPDGVCFTLFLRDHLGASLDGGLYPVPEKAQEAPGHPQSRRGQDVAPRSAPPETSRDPGYPLRHRRPRLRTLSAPGHRHRLQTDGDPRAPRQGQTRSLRDAPARPAPAPAALLEALSTPEFIPICGRNSRGSRPWRTRSSTSVGCGATMSIAGSSAVAASKTEAASGRWASAIG